MESFKAFCEDINLKNQFQILILKKSDLKEFFVVKVAHQTMETTYHKITF